MKFHGATFLRRLLKETSGQTMYIGAAALSAIIGLSGMAVDFSHGYFALQELQASTNATAMAGAFAMPNTTQAATNIANYSSKATGLNSSTLLTSAVATPTFLCLNTLVKQGLACVGSTGSTSGTFNAVRVVQTANAPTWFGSMFGLANFKLTAVSTAAYNGGAGSPWNIAVVLDTTASMGDSDSGKQCSGTQISCALTGVRDLLLLLDPCSLNTTCTAVAGTSQVQSSVASVSLFVFPALAIATDQSDYGKYTTSHGVTTFAAGCPVSTPGIVPYTFPSNTGTGLTEQIPSTLGTYQVIPFSSNYRASDSATTLNTAADIVIASGGAGCAGITAPGGEGTYYAQVIYAAQAALVAEQNANPGSQNAMIILSDGDATSSASSGQIAVASGGGTLNGTGGNTSYTYPSALGECGQAVQAAYDAANNSSYNNTGSFTRVYTIGYGAETSGCTTDKTYSATVTGGGGSWGPGDSPCQSIAAMASDPGYFYSDDANGCASSNGTNYTQLTQIFQAIATSFSTPRLVPNTTT